MAFNKDSGARGAQSRIQGQNLAYRSGITDGIDGKTYPWVAGHVATRHQKDMRHRRNYMPEAYCDGLEVGFAIRLLILLGGGIVEGGAE